MSNKKNAKDFLLYATYTLCTKGRVLLMTDRELHKLRRTELLELLLQLRKELDTSRAEIETLRKRAEAYDRQSEQLEELLRLTRRIAGITEESQHESEAQ